MVNERINHCVYTSFIKTSCNFELSGRNTSFPPEIKERIFKSNSYSKLIWSPTHSGCPHSAGVTEGTTLCWLIEGPSSPFTYVWEKTESNVAMNFVAGAVFVHWASMRFAYMYINTQMLTNKYLPVFVNMGAAIKRIIMMSHGSFYISLVSSIQQMSMQCSKKGYSCVKIPHFCLRRVTFTLNMSSDFWAGCDNFMS